MCFGSVQSLNTRSRGASKVRERTSSPWGLNGSAHRAPPTRELLDSLPGALLAATLVLLGFQPVQIVVEAIETVGPETAIVLDPAGYVPERAGVELAREPLRFAAAGDQAGAFEDFQVLGNGREGHFEGLSQLGDRRFAGGKFGEDRAPSGIGKGGEG